MKVFRSSCAAFYILAASTLSAQEPCEPIVQKDNSQALLTKPHTPTTAEIVIDRLGTVLQHGIVPGVILTQKNADLRAVLVFAIVNEAGIALGKYMLDWPNSSRLTPKIADPANPKLEKMPDYLFRKVHTYSTLLLNQGIKIGISMIPFYILSKMGCCKLLYQASRQSVVVYITASTITG